MSKTPKTPQDMKAEEQRQARILTDAIHDTIMETAKQFDHPMMNALAGALISNEASMLASVKDARVRKALRKVMDATRPRALAEAMQRDTGTAQIVVMGGIKH